LPSAQLGVDATTGTQKKNDTLGGKGGKGHEMEESVG